MARAVIQATRQPCPGLITYLAESDPDDGARDALRGGRGQTVLRAEHDDERGGELGAEPPRRGEPGLKEG